MERHILIKKIIEYCSVSYPEPKPEDSEEIKQNQNIRIQCVNELTYILSTSLPDEDLEEIIWGFIRNIDNNPYSDSEKQIRYSFGINLIRLIESLNLMEVI